MEKLCLLNCPHQCNDTPKSQYCITILKKNIDISIYCNISHITIDEQTEGFINEQLLCL